MLKFGMPLAVSLLIWLILYAFAIALRGSETKSKEKGRDERILHRGFYEEKNYDY